MPHKKELWSTFRGNNNFPVYNWFYFTEAFSRGLVRSIILKFPVKTQNPKLKTQNPKLLDPFCGTGTSLLVAKEMGIESTGTDVSPLMCCIAKGKTQNYNFDKLEKLQLDVLKTDSITATVPIEIKPEQKWIKQYFFADNLQDILQIKKNIDKIETNEKYFFYCVLLHIVEIVSKARKQGADLRIQKKPHLDVKDKFQKTFRLYLKEYKKLQKKSSDKEPKVINTNCLNYLEKNKKEKFDYIICSPPYLNKTEYTKRFGIELTILDKESILKEHLGSNTRKIDELNHYCYPTFFKKELHILENPQYKMPDYSIDSYFQQLETFVKESAEHLNKNGVLAIVIAGGCFRELSIDILEYMKELYKINCLNLEDINIHREIQCHRDRTTKTGRIKEFTIVGKRY